MSHVRLHKGLQQKQCLMRSRQMVKHFVTTPRLLGLVAASMRARNRLKQIIDTVKHLHRFPLPHHIQYDSRKEIEMQIVSLLYELLHVSGNKSVEPMEGSRKY